MRIVGLFILFSFVSMAYAEEKCDSVKPDSNPKDIESCLIGRFQKDKPILNDIINEYSLEDGVEAIWACNPSKMDSCESNIRRKLIEAKVFWVHYHSGRYWFSVFEGGQDDVSHGYAFVYPLPEDRICSTKLETTKRGTCEIDLGDQWGLSHTWYAH